MKAERVDLKTNKHVSEGILMMPGKTKKPGVILGHGAGGNMHARFLAFFHERIAEAGYPSLKFNFFYSHAGKKAPDPRPLLIACYDKAIDALPARKVIIGGKSMGGRIASYGAASEKVAGLLFLGYPLHPPGKPDELRDEHLYTISKPMLFISGTRDPFARRDLLEGTIGKIGHSATVHWVEDGGHSFEVPKSKGKSELEVWTDVFAKIEARLKEVTGRIR